MISYMGFGKGKCSARACAICVPLVVLLRVVSGVIADSKVFRPLFRQVLRLVFHPHNHAVFLEQPHETQDGRGAPVPGTCQLADARRELAALRTAFWIVDSGLKDAYQV